MPGVSSKATASVCEKCLHSMMLLRLGALATQVVGYGIAAFLGVYLPLVILSVLWLTLAVYTLGMLRPQASAHPPTDNDVLREATIDIAYITFSVYLTGGSSNPLIILLLLPVTVTAATSRSWQIWLVTGVAVTCYTALMFFHQDFPLPPDGMSGFGLHVEGMWYGFIASAVLIAYFLAQMGASLRASDLALAETREEALVENSPTGVFLAQSGRLAFANPRLADLLGYRREQLTGSLMLRLVHPGDRPRIRRQLRRLTAGEQQAIEVECRVRARSGQALWIAARIVQVTYRGEVMLQGSVQDFTERKRMEMELRELSARIIEIQEEERRRVARDLHDGICQTLTAIRFVLESELGDIAVPERRGSMVRLRSLVPTLQAAGEEVRRISTALRPAMLDDLGLLATLRWFIGEQRKLHRDLAIHDDLRVVEGVVPDSLKTAIFRLVQEATSNAVKHGHATILEVTLTATEGTLRLVVKDNGVGFVPGATAAAGLVGLGLGSMRERAKFSGGTLRLTSAPGSGTSVDVCWPPQHFAFND